MTTYNENLAAQQQVGFPELYKFSFGNVTEYYTSWTENITFDGNIYRKAPIKRDKAYL